MDLQWEIFLKVNSLKREQNQKKLSLKEGSSFQPLRQGRILTEHLHQTGEKLGSKWGEISGDL